MLRGQRHKGHAKDGVWPCGEDGNLLALPFFKLKIAGQALAFANPVALHGDNFFRPAAQFVQIRQQLLGIVSNFEEPAVHVLGHNLLIAAPAAAVNHLLPRQHGSAIIAPVDRGFLAIDQPFF